jgi:hypothetical protein
VSITSAEGANAKDKVQTVHKLFTDSDLPRSQAHNDNIIQ